jgi:hypothetical protein
MITIDIWPTCDGLPSLWLFLVFFTGAVLASLIDRAIDGELTPVAVGFVVYSSVGLLLQLRGRRALLQNEPV